ncbi:MAG: HAMP domain-containing sensor histidine kinase [Brumimicrobium sp.]
MKTKSLQYSWLFVAIVSILLSWIFYSVFFNTDLEKEKEQFQNSIIELQNEQHQFLDYSSKIISTSTVNDLWENKNLTGTKFSINLYNSDSLIFWNNNKAPLKQQLKEIFELKVPKVLELSNGFYLVYVKRVHNLTLVVSSKVKHSYYYENTSLKNTLTKKLSLPDNIKLYVKNKKETSVINDVNGKPLFYISFTKTKSISDYKQLLIFGLYVIGLLCLLTALAKFLLPFTSKRPWLIITYPITILILRWISIKNSWIQLFSEFEIYNPKLYASSELFPNLGSLVISIGCLLVIVWWIYRLVVSHENSNRKINYLLILLYLGLFPCSYFISWLFESLVLNSTISLVIDEVFSLSIYSFVALVIIAALFFGYYVLARVIIRKLVNSKIQLNHLALLWFLTGVTYFIAEIFFFQKNIYNALWPILLNAILFFIASKKQNQLALKYQLIVLVVVSFYAAFILFESNQSNEYQKRDLYANQLVTDQDPTTEIEYLSTVEQIKKDSTFKEMLDDSKEYSAQKYADRLEECCLNSFWERYEMNYFLFDEATEPIINYISNQTISYDELEEIVKNNGMKSSFSEALYFIENYYDRLSYVAKQPLKSKSGEKITLFILFRSKKIPEQIGFPRLLMNETSYALKDLEDYSIARYSNGKLVMRFGNFNYPTRQDNFTNKYKLENGFTSSENVSHYIYQKEGNQTVIISKSEKRLIEKMTTFSYLFLFFGIFSMLILLFNQRNKIMQVKSLQLSFKIQLVLIGIVVVSFVVFAFVAGNYTRNQYHRYSHDNLKEKANSVETEVSQKLGDKDELDRDILGNYMQYILKKFSTVFVTDINLYDLNGGLLASSQPKLYEKGINAEHMNSNAYKAMSFDRKSEFIHQEVIGELEYLSAYLPFINNQGKLLGYLNLQHFAKQNAYENQVNDFIVTIINIAVLLLVITVVIAIFVSSWITTPLRLIQESFKNVELGKQNQPIAYKGDDEIGALVKDYNDKLAELELKAMQLARSERETAWREMAKQVAHEIKNPLTPMRLSLQHFQRSFDPTAENAQEKINRIADSLVEQIDILTKIANEFSNFAKMPKANEQRINLIPLIENVINLYQSEAVDISLNTTLKDAVVFVDKDLIIRVFNNLIKNAIQATAEDQTPQISIKIERENDRFLIRIKDNGDGISDEVKNKIFVPNFTTKSTGAGLGLAMVKQIINNHNGEIWFETEKGKGTTFFILLEEYFKNE